MRNILSIFILSFLLAPWAQALVPTDHTIVLVHGAFADATASWSRVTTMLQERGFKVVAVQNPLTSFAEDVAATERALANVKGPVVLVGHSWGGFVITQAGSKPNVHALVYVAAFAPSEGQSVLDLTKDYPVSPGFGQLVIDSFGYGTLTEMGMKKYFAQDLPRKTTSLMFATQIPTAATSFAEKATIASWKTKPSWYVVAETDHMIQPALQKAMASKIGATMTAYPGSHVIMQSQPLRVVNAILAAAGVEK
ncbi:hypothetical protein AZI87_02585 [Bdellovibrio bacteriovorus]|uniref:AB hydrolase-1 domain-containing protein n=1 Tax=Bdellovibrio bacteriovorus TaxID=959 RepID=A0A162GHJ9_BDEBC|nr:alpha/beta hydrolase [Bdellovibrio bacteriovorus]KYG68167.1 hypothetical protein AZI87_02585 [Bdellovibrio bacteriovorus]